jgi:DNA-binding protein
MDFVIKKLDPDYNVYLNIAHFAKSRGYEITDESYPLSEDSFINKKNSEKHILVLNKTVNFFQITTDSDFNKKDKLLKVINRLNPDIKLFIIKPNTVKIGKIPYENEVISGNTYLIKNWTEEDIINKGRKVLRADSQWEFVKEKFIVDDNNLPGLDITSHEAVWLGLKVGDVVYLETPSLSSNGTQSGYHIVV